MQNVEQIERGPAPSFAEFAALDFDAWVHQPDEWAPPTNEEWGNLANPNLVAVRLAWVTLHKSKPELIEMVKGMDDDDVFQSYADCLEDGINFFKTFLAILEPAHVRILCAAANVVEGGAA